MSAAWCPGSMSGKATEIYQEGVRIPPIKIIEKGRINEAALDLLMANMRVPEERLGDLNASFAVVPRRRDAHPRNLRALRRRPAARGGAPRPRPGRGAHAREHRRLPDGTYHYEDYLETFMGGVFEPLLLPLALTIRADRMIADFTGASAQVPFPVNSTAAVSAAAVFIAVKSIFDPPGATEPGLVPPDRGDRAAGDHRQRAAPGARRLARRDPQAGDRDHGRRALPGGAGQGRGRPLPHLVPQPARRASTPGPGANGCTTNGRPEATAPSPRMTARAPWPRSIGATSSRCNPRR